MKKIIIPVLAVIIVYSSCKEDKKNDFFPILSYLKSQVKQVDTSLYSIIKVTTVDSVSDTTNIRREDFSREAEDFTSIPDLTSAGYAKLYKENRSFDESINRAVFSYYPVKNNAEILREEVIISPGFGEEDKVNSVYIEKVREEKGQTIQKRMNWKVKESFMIITITQIPGKPDKIEKTELIWNKPAESGL